MYYEIPLDNGERAVFYIPGPETEMDEWKIRRGIAYVQELVERLGGDKEVPENDSQIFKTLVRANCGIVADESG